MWLPSCGVGTPTKLVRSLPTFLEKIVSFQLVPLHIHLFPKYLLSARGARQNT